MNTKKFARWVKLYCFDNGISVENFMRNEFGLSRSMYYKWIHGVTMPFKDDINKFIQLSKGDLKKEDFDVR